MSKVKNKEQPYTKERFLREIQYESCNYRYKALWLFSHSPDLCSNIEEYKDIIKDVALNDSSEKVRNSAAFICRKYNITNNGEPFSKREIPTLDNIDDIMIDVYKRCNIPYTPNSLNERHLNKLKSEFKHAYPEEYTTMFEAFPTMHKFRLWIKSKYRLYKEAVEPVKNSPYPLDYDLDILKKPFSYNEVQGDILPVNYEGLPKVNVFIVNKCKSHGFDIVSHKQTRLYQLRDTFSGDIIAGSDFKMYPSDILMFLEKYEIEHPIILPKKLWGLYFPDLNKRVESTYNKIGEGHRVRDYVEKFKEQHEKAIEKYMVGWCGRKANGHTNPDVDYSLCLIFSLYLNRMNHLSNIEE